MLERAVDGLVVPDPLKDQIWVRVAGSKATTSLLAASERKVAVLPNVGGETRVTLAAGNCDGGAVAGPSAGFWKNKAVELKKTSWPLTSGCEKMFCPKAGVAHLCVVRSVAYRYPFVSRFTSKKSSPAGVSASWPTFDVSCFPIVPVAIVVPKIPPVN